MTSNMSFQKQAPEVEALLKQNDKQANTDDIK